jgi:hypothetical protein
VADASLSRRNQVIIGELKRPLSAIFRRDVFAHGELMRFFG